MEHLKNAIPKASDLRNEMMEKDNEFNKKIEKEIARVNNRIMSAKERGETRTCFSTNNETEYIIRQMYASKGYTFRPTGYVGGVYQHTEDICW